MTAGHAIGLRTLTNEYVDEPVSLEGSLPEWLTGTLVRNGPGEFETDDGPLQHWFDGLALIRRFGLDGSADTVRFSARFLRSAEYEHVRQTGSLKTGQFGTAHTDSYLEHLRDIVRWRIN
jgi:Lignostilbene-alpha,beta-dioxygenase and related enzymes